MTVHQLPTAVKAAKTSEPEKKLCVQCKHCGINKNYYFITEFVCEHPSNMSLVDNQPKDSAEFTRTFSCKGKHWEAKIWPPVTRRPWWKFWSK